MSFLRRINAVSVEKGDDIAVIDAGRSLTYSEVRLRSNAVARCLRGKCSGSEGGFVALLLPRSADFPVAALGVLKAGMAFVAISDANPLEYNAAVLSECSPAAVISTCGLWERNSGLRQTCSVPVILLDGPGFGCQECGDIDFSTEGGSAALIFTSGTTGHPKAVLHTLGSLSFLFDYMLEGVAGLAAPGRQFVCALDFCFLAGLPDIFMPLMCGAACRIVPENLMHNLDALSALLKENDVVHMLSVGEVVKSLVSKAAGVKYYSSTGGRMPEILHLLPQGTVVKNVYGMTESGPGLSYFLKGGETPVPIGRPVRGVSAWLLDERLVPVPDGQTGEIFICSDGLAAGYYNNESLTRERFMDCPFEPGRRMFRTGDYARVLPSGEWLFCGRRDDMVKVRGVRMNTTEIEYAALSCEGVDAAAAVVNEKGVLCLLYEGSASREELACRLKCKLPEAMFPGFLRRVDAIPVNGRGKRDLGKMMELLAAGCAGSEILNPLQEKVLSAIRRVLGIECIGLRDDLFSFGGNSLNVAALVAGLPELPLTVKTVYERRSAEGIAAAVESASAGGGGCREAGQVCLSPFQKRVLDTQLTDPGAIMWNNPLLFRFESDCDAERLYDALLLVARHHPALSCTVDPSAGTLRYLPGAVPPVAVRPLEADASPESLIKESLKPFPLDGGLLWRAFIYAGSDGGYLFLDFHHLIFDGTSFVIFMDSLFLAYRGENLPEDDFFRCAADALRSCHSPGTASDLEGWSFTPLPEAASEGRLHYHTQQYDTLLSMCDIENAGRRSGLTLNVYAISAAARALSDCTSSSRVAVNWMSDNRTTSAVLHSFGAYIKMFTVFLDLEGVDGASVPEMVSRQVEQCLAGKSPEFVNGDVSSGRDPVLVNNLTGRECTYGGSPFRIRMVDFPYCIYEPIEYLDIELFFLKDNLHYNISSGCRINAGKNVSLFRNRFDLYLKEYIK